jgi:hypothetical protein
MVSQPASTTTSTLQARVRMRTGRTIGPSLSLLKMVPEWGTAIAKSVLRIVKGHVFDEKNLVLRRNILARNVCMTFDAALRRKAAIDEAFLGD